MEPRSKNRLEASNFEALEDESPNGRASVADTSMRRSTEQTSLYPGEVKTNELTELIPVQKSSRRRRVVFALLLLAFFCNGCGFSIPAPFFPREAAGKDVSSTTIGLIFGCFQLVNFLSSPLFGQFLPDLGPKQVCGTGILVAGGSAILFGFLDKVTNRPLFVALSFILRILEALGASAASTAIFAIICTEFEDRVAFSIAMLNAACWFNDRAHGRRRSISGQHRSSILKLLTCPLVWVSSLLLFMGAVAVIFLDPTLSIHLSQFNLTAFEISLFFVIIPLLHACLSPFVGYICDLRNTHVPLMLASCITCAVGFLMIGPTPLIPALPRTMWFTVLGLVVFGLMFSCTIIPVMKCFVLGATEIGFPDNISTFGVVAGLFNSIYYLGAFVGPTIGDAIVERIGFPHATTVIAAMFLATFLVMASFFGFQQLQENKQKAVEAKNDPNP